MANSVVPMAKPPVARAKIANAGRAWFALAPAPAVGDGWTDVSRAEEGIDVFRRKETDTAGPAVVAVPPAQEWLETGPEVVLGMPVTRSLIAIAGQNPSCTTTDR